LAAVDAAGAVEGAADSLELALAGGALGLAEAAADWLPASTMLAAGLLAAAMLLGLLVALPAPRHDVHSVDDMVATASRIAREEGFAKAGDQIAITAGMPFGQPGTTNLLRIAEIEG